LSSLLLFAEARSETLLAVFVTYVFIYIGALYKVRFKYLFLLQWVESWKLVAVCCLISINWCISCSSTGHGSHSSI